MLACALQNAAQVAGRDTVRKCRKPVEKAGFHDDGLFCAGLVEKLVGAAGFEPTTS
jgi:hypothetical protein